MKYKEGDILKINQYAYKVLGIAGIVYILSSGSDHDCIGSQKANMATDKDLERINAKIEPQPWEPKENEELFFINSKGHVGVTTYINSKQSIDRIGFGNCFRTREEAEAALERVRAALKQV